MNALSCRAFPLFQQSTGLLENSPFAERLKAASTCGRYGTLSQTLPGVVGRLFFVALIAFLSLSLDSCHPAKFHPVMTDLQYLNMQSVSLN